jgi:hypothetical protein
MNTLTLRRTLGLLLLAGCFHGATAQAAAIHPANDDEVIETLPAVVGDRAEERRLRRELAARPLDAQLAASVARRRLQQARESGDPRFAGQACSAAKAWPDAQRAPTNVLLMQASVEQFLHAFDPAAAKLELLLKREPRDAQAWLTLATIRRVQGRYADSDVACTAMQKLGADVYAQACRAENDSLRGNFDTARATLKTLLATPRLPAETRGWLLTTWAELEERAGQPADAEAAYQAALATQRDGYTLISYADFLLALGRDADVLAQLRGEPRSDAVLLRLAIAGTRSESAAAVADARELRERIAQANQRPEARLLHAREQAMFALWVDKAPQRALALAQSNVKLQREAIDLWVLAQAARASGQPAALRDAARLIDTIGLRDARTAALL